MSHIQQFAALVALVIIVVLTASRAEVSFGGEDVPHEALMVVAVFSVWVMLSVALFFMFLS